MNSNRQFLTIKNKLILTALVVPVLIAAWWVFRPEKLFINKTVSEAAPVSLSSEPEALFTGKLEKRAHDTSGRATIYKDASGRQYLRLTDFATSNGPDVHVVLVRADDEGLAQNITKDELEHVELGTLKGNQGDQNYDLPEGVDLAKYQAVAIYCVRFHALFGLAKLEKF